jgi:hypothetical protein
MHRHLPTCCICDAIICDKLVCYAIVNTSTFVNRSEYRKHMDDVLKAELGSSLHIGVPGFYEAFFGDIPNVEEQNDMAECFFL